MKIFSFLLSLISIQVMLTAQGVPTQEKLTNYLADLVAINTVTADKEANLRALKRVQQQLKTLPLHFKFYEFNGYHSLVITTRPTQKPDVWLIAHIDVVPGAANLFEPRIENNKMYGRGTYDMKMAIACYILLMHELKDSLQHYNIGIMLTSDEEIGGMNGVRCLLQEGYSSSVALLPDGGFNWNFEEAAKGVLHVKLSAFGKSAHSSRPWMGENAITRLMAALSDIQTYFEGQKLLHPHYYPTANLGLIAGGKGINLVPDHAEAQIDIRFPPTLCANEIYEQLQKSVKAHCNVELRKIIEGSPNHVDLSQKYFQQFKKLAKEMYDIEVDQVQSHGSSDARFFGEKNIPVLVIAPRGDGIHSDDEWIDLEDLVRFYAVMKSWVMKTACSPILAEDSF